MDFGRTLMDLACCGMRRAGMPACHDGLSSPAMVAMEFYMAKIIMNDGPRLFSDFVGKNRSAMTHSHLSRREFRMAGTRRFMAG